MGAADNETFHDKNVKRMQEYYDTGRRNRYRLCKVGDRKALFHRWYEERQIVPPSLMTGGHQGGEIATTMAIVEYLDGQVARVHPERVIFLDTDEHRPDKRNKGR